MKKLLLVISVAVVIFACEKEEKKERRDLLDPNALVSIYPAKGVKSESNPEHLSALEIVKQTAEMQFINKRDYPFEESLRRGFGDPMRDTIAPRLMMWARDIIYLDTTLVTAFLYAENIILVRDMTEILNEIRDTIAYIPNSVMRLAESLIVPAFNDGDYTTCYELFDSLFVFEPITADEYRELKKQGEN